MIQVTIIIISRRIPITETYTLNGLYPNTLYYIWLAARSQRGEGATTPPIAVRTKQYGMLRANELWWNYMWSCESVEVRRDFINVLYQSY